MFGLLTQWSGSTADSVTINWAKVYFDQLYRDLRPYSDDHDPSPSGDLMRASPLRLHSFPQTMRRAPDADMLTSSEQWAACGDERHMSAPGCWDSWRMYIAALYWSAMTVTTIGYVEAAAAGASCSCDAHTHALARLLTCSSLRPKLAAAGTEILCQQMLWSRSW